MLQTNINESLDLLTPKLLVYFFALGVLPAYIVYKTHILHRNFKKELLSKGLTILISLAIIAGSMFLFSKHYTSFVRENKPLRLTTNPTYWIYSSIKYINQVLSSGKIVLQPTGTDAKINNTDKKLVILVVGEAARADHFSLNGYSRKTNPLLEKEDIVNYPNMYSCGTDTATSVPCMFSILSREEYSHKKGLSHENILDVLKHTGKVAILWRDNNSDSKGVALKVAYQNYQTNHANTICTDGECRDEGMLVDLNKYIDQNREKNILIILHQMGNHGPAYYKRYPEKFKKFTPVCQTNQVEECKKEEITNAYDNAILYTDYFLTQTINFLKKHNTTHKVAMLYMSDHGESLGENGVYLHGLPYFMAPDAQTHIGSLFWFGKSMKESIDIKKIKSHNIDRYSQDNLFHTLLGIFDVSTKVYKKDMDILNVH